MDLVVIALSIGAAYALLALSINVIYATSNILNFAQGELMMLGGMLGWVFYSQLQLPYPLALLLVVGGVGLVGVIEYFMTVWPLARRGAPIIAVIIATLGFSVVVKIGAALMFGGVQRFARPPLGDESLQIGPLHMLPQNALIVAITAATLVLLWLVYTRTTVGLALRAAAINSDGARLVGVNVPLVVLVTFGVGAALAGLAGLILSPLSYASPWLGLQFAILGFAAAIIGGLGSWPGAVAGGLTLGIIQTLLFRYVSAQWGDLLTFALLLIVLYVRPSGIFRELQAAAGWSR